MGGSIVTARNAAPIAGISHTTVPVLTSIGLHSESGSIFKVPDHPLWPKQTVQPNRDLGHLSMQFPIELEFYPRQSRREREWKRKRKRKRALNYIWLCLASLYDLSLTFRGRNGDATSVLINLFSVRPLVRKERGKPYLDFMELPKLRSRCLLDQGRCPDGAQLHSTHGFTRCQGIGGVISLPGKVGFTWPRVVRPCRFLGNTLRDAGTKKQYIPLRKPLVDFCEGRQRQTQLKVH